MLLQFQLNFRWISGDLCCVTLLDHGLWESLSRDCHHAHRGLELARPSYPNFPSTAVPLSSGGGMKVR